MSILLLSLFSSSAATSVASCLCIIILLLFECIIIASQGSNFRFRCRSNLHMIFTKNIQLFFSLKNILLNVVNCSHTDHFVLDSIKSLAVVISLYSYFHTSSCFVFVIVFHLPASHQIHLTHIHLFVHSFTRSLTYSIIKLANCFFFSTSSTSFFHSLHLIVCLNKTHL